MLVNVWLEIRDNFDWPPVQDENGNPVDTELQAKNRATLSRAADREVVTGLFKTRQQGPRTWAIYSLNYQVETNQELEQAVERFQSENPGDTNVMGAWHFEDGRQFGTEPAVFDEDGNEIEPVTGVPLYPIPGSLLNHMPDIVVYDVDGNEISRDDATELTDVNLLFGQAPRIFS